MLKDRKMVLYAKERRKGRCEKRVVSKCKGVYWIDDSIQFVQVNIRIIELVVVEK